MRRLASVLTCCVRMRTLTLAVVLATIACGTEHDRDRSRRPVYDAVPYQAEIEESLGAAVAILIDTSGSMKAPAPGGDGRPKKVARDALEAMLDATDAFVAKRPTSHQDRRVSFSSHVRRLQRSHHNRDELRRTLASVPVPAAAPRSAKPWRRHARISIGPACSASICWL